jgi:hypothetical protein
VSELIKIVTVTEFMHPVLRAYDLLTANSKYEKCALRCPYFMACMLWFHEYPHILAVKDITYCYRASYLRYFLHQQGEQVKLFSLDTIMGLSSFNMLTGNGAY